MDVSVLPLPRGPVSDALITTLRSTPHDMQMPSISDLEPYGSDLHLALYTCYELHYRGFDGVDDEWEWNPELLRFRAELERIFLAHLRAHIPAGDDVDAEMSDLSIEPIRGSGPSHYLVKEGTWQQMQEYFVHRSLYHLKEADPHAWTIPRLTGQAKAAFVAVEFDEFGAGRQERMHAQLFADLLTAADLDASYLGYIDVVPAETLALVNVMSLFGLHRSLRGASVGHFAATEITSSPGSRRLVRALTRMDAPAACRTFYAEHVEADAVHEQIVRHDVIGDLARREPSLKKDIVFGMRAFDYVETKLAEVLMSSWTSDSSSLLAPIQASS